MDDRLEMRTGRGDYGAGFVGLEGLVAAVAFGHGRRLLWLFRRGFQRSQIRQPPPMHSEMSGSRLRQLVGQRARWLAVMGAPHTARLILLGFGSKR